MSVYVDNLAMCKPTAKWPYDTHSHLVGDSIQELFDFATEKLGLRGKWMQSNTLPHFDLTSGKRASALEKGATEIGPAGLVERIKQYRERKCQRKNEQPVK